VVLVDRDLGGLSTDLVATDNLEGGRTAAQHLLDLGHRRIGVITGKLGTTTGADRFRGFREALAAAGAYRSEFIVEGAYDRDSGYDGMQRLLALPERPTAVLAGNDLMAIGAMQALSEQGLCVPQNMSVVGYDDIAFASVTTPGLTTVAQPKYQMGASAVEVLLQRLMEEGGPPRRVLLRPRLVVRGTTVNHE
jgi:LacI family transcriptional regulator